MNDDFTARFSALLFQEAARVFPLWTQKELTTIAHYLFCTSFIHVAMENGWQFEPEIDWVEATPEVNNQVLAMMLPFTMYMLGRLDEAWRTLGGLDRVWHTIQVKPYNAELRCSYVCQVLEECCLDEEGINPLAAISKIRSMERAYGLLNTDLAPFTLQDPDAYLATARDNWIMGMRPILGTPPG